MRNFLLQSEISVLRMTKNVLMGNLNKTIYELVRIAYILLSGHFRNCVFNCSQERLNSNGVLAKWSGTFSEFSESVESDKSLKHELG